jgi:flagellar protein FlbT
MHITLRPGEKLYLNGAVLRADRKVSIELMNDATFLLEAHIMHADKATTPIRQLYFVVQMMLMNPLETTAPLRLFKESVERMQNAYTDATMLEVIGLTHKLVTIERYFDALKIMRSVFDRDEALMASEKDLPPPPALPDLTAIERRSQARKSLAA